MDILDQISEAAEAVEARRSSRRSAQEHHFTFVFQIGRKWHDGTFDGRISPCLDAIEEAIKKHGMDPDKIRWGCVYIKDKRPELRGRLDSLVERKLLEALKHTARQR